MKKDYVFTVVKNRGTMMLYVSGLVVNGKEQMITKVINQNDVPLKYVDNFTSGSYTFAADLLTIYRYFKPSENKWITTTPHKYEWLKVNKPYIRAEVVCQYLTIDI